MGRSLFSVCVISLFLLTVCGSGEKAEKKEGDDLPYLNVEFTPDCRWGATPDNVMNVMFNMANLRQSDVLYDLGCGDGRVVVEAVTRYGLRGIGIDIDPEKIIASRKRAADAGVAHKATFANRDIFESDFSDATVLALFLSTDVLMKLRPRFLVNLRPGTRIILHTHSMGAWEPDSHQKMDIECFDPEKTGCFRTVKLFIVPANVTGEWAWETAGRKFVMKVEQKFQTVRAVIREGEAALEVQHARLRGKELAFTFNDRSGSGVKLRYGGVVEGDTIRGSIAREGETSPSPMPWKARRVSGTAVSIAR